MSLEAILAADGRAVIVALDHGLIDGPLAGLLDMAEVIGRVAAGGADAVLISYGTAQRFGPELEGLGKIVRIDGSIPGEGPTGSLFFTPEQARRAGADMVVVSAFPFSAHAGGSLAALAAAIGEAGMIGLPVLAEMVPGGFNGPAPTGDQIALAARIASELGADMIKTPYCDGFENVSRSAFVPVVILGGSRKASERDMLGHVHASIEAGGAGVAIGRNVFQAADPQAMTAALVAIVHGGAGVDQAAALLSSG